MIKFWAIAILIFIIVTIILAKFTLKENRKEVGEKNWKLWYGRSVYWRILTLCSFGITVGIMLIMYWAGVPILQTITTFYNLSLKLSLAEQWIF